MDMDCKQYCCKFYDLETRKNLFVIYGVDTVQVEKRECKSCDKRAESVK